MRPVSRESRKCRRGTWLRAGVGRDIAFGGVRRFAFPNLRNPQSVQFLTKPRDHVLKIRKLNRILGFPVRPAAAAGTRGRSAAAVPIQSGCGAGPACWRGWAAEGAVPSPIMPSGASRPGVRAAPPWQPLPLPFRDRPGRRPDTSASGAAGSAAGLFERITHSRPACSRVDAEGS